MKKIVVSLTVLFVLILPWSCHGANLSPTQITIDYSNLKEVVISCSGIDSIEAIYVCDKSKAQRITACTLSSHKIVITADNESTIAELLKDGEYTLRAIGNKDGATVYADAKLIIKNYPGIYPARVDLSRVAISDLSFKISPKIAAVRKIEWYNTILGSSGAYDNTQYGYNPTTGVLTVKGSAITACAPKSTGNLRNSLVKLTITGSNNKEYSVSIFVCDYVVKATPLMCYYYTSQPIPAVYGVDVYGEDEKYVAFASVNNYGVFPTLSQKYINPIYSATNNTMEIKVSEIESAIASLRGYTKIKGYPEIVHDTLGFNSLGPKDYRLSIYVRIAEKAPIMDTIKTFDKITPNDVSFSVQNADYVDSVVFNGRELTYGADYTYENGIFTIKQIKFASLPFGSYPLSVCFNTGVRTATITVKDGTATISPTGTQTFDKNAPTDLVYTLTNASAIAKISFGETVIGTAGYNYSGNTLTIKKEQIAALTTGSYDGILETNNGNLHVPVKIECSSTSVASISPSVAIFNKSTPVDVTFELSNFGVLSEVELSGEKLTASDYTLSDGNLKILKERLATCQNMSNLLKVTTTNGEIIATIDIIDSASSVSITPETIYFDKCIMGNVVCTLSNYGKLLLVKIDETTLVDPAYNFVNGKLTIQAATLLNIAVGTHTLTLVTEKGVLASSIVVSESVPAEEEAPHRSDDGNENRGGGGGCNTGVGVLVLLFVLPLFCRKKK